MTRGLALSMMAAGLMLTHPVWAHLFFASLAEVEYDSARGAIEVSLRVDDHNLEDALRLQHGRDYRLATDESGERDARDYVAAHFVIQAADGRTLDLEWVGWEWSTGMAWMHFEFPGPADPSRLRLSNSLFIELSDQQVNTVNVRSGKSHRTLTFDRKIRTLGLGLPADSRMLSGTK